MNVRSLQKLKTEGTPIVCVTAYDALEVQLAEAAGVDVVLVGDSVANTKLGFSHTNALTLGMMEHHIAASSRGHSGKAMLVGDLPFGSYNSGVGQAVESSVALVRCGAEAVKLEGTYVEEIRAIFKAGIPVMGHLGMTPQSHLVFGGHRVQGKSAETAAALQRDARQLQEAGCFAIVLELIPADLARQITESLEIPTIGIGAGLRCDGQIQVITDLLGLGEQSFKHAKAYADLRATIIAALGDYASEVRQGSFPGAEHSF